VAVLRWTSFVITPGRVIVHSVRGISFCRSLLRAVGARVIMNVPIEPVWARNINLSKSVSDSNRTSMGRAPSGALIFVPAASSTATNFLRKFFRRLLTAY